MLICGELGDGRATQRIWNGICMEQLVVRDERKGGVAALDGLVCGLRELFVVLGL
jgi:hypothetical protein